MISLFNDPVQNFVDKLQSDRKSAKEFSSLADNLEFCRNLLQNLGKNNTLDKKMINTRFAASVPFVNHFYGV